MTEVTADTPTKRPLRIPALGWLFGFSGRIGPIRFLAGLALAFALTVICAVALTLVLGRGGRSVTILASLAVLIWSWFALSAKRLRDMGASPWLALSMLIVPIGDHALAQRIDWRFLWPDQNQTPVGGLFQLLFVGALLLWPSRADHIPSGQLVDAPGPMRINPALAAPAFAVAGLALATLVNPWNPPGCAAGASATADCSRFGAVGRVYTAMLLTRANRMLDRGKAEAALANIERALTIRPNYAHAFNSRGIAYAAIGDHTAALAAYDRSLAIRPDYAHARVNRAASVAALAR